MPSEMLKGPIPCLHSVHESQAYVDICDRCHVSRAQSPLPTPSVLHTSSRNSLEYNINSHHQRWVLCTRQQPEREQKLCWTGRALSQGEAEGYVACNAG